MALAVLEQHDASRLGLHQFDGRKTGERSWMPRVFAMTRDEAEERLTAVQRRFRTSVAAAECGARAGEGTEGRHHHCGDARAHHFASADRTRVHERTQLLFVFLARVAGGFHAARHVNTEWTPLIPLALKGVTYRPIGAGPLLRRNLLIYGLGGIIIPFIGIKAIDLAVSALHLA